jgi:hypothetical protein
MKTCDIVQLKNNTAQYACICRSKILGFSDNAYALTLFDGPIYTYGTKLAVFGDCCTTDWQTATPNLTGTISISHNSNQVNGTSTLFTSELAPGDKIIVGMKQHVVDTITNNTTLTLTENYHGMEDMNLMNKTYHKI